MTEGGAGGHRFDLGFGGTGMDYFVMSFPGAGVAGIVVVAAQCVLFGGSDMVY